MCVLNHMDSEEYKKLEKAKKIILEKNMDALDKCKVKVVSSKIETNKKYGPQCVIILQSDNN